MKRKFYKLSNNSFKEKGVKNYKSLWKKLKEEGFDGMCIECFTIFKKEEGSSKLHAIFSTAKEDRHGDIVLQEWDLKSFKKNPVYLDSHNYSSIEHIIGKVEKIKIKDNKLQGDIVFAMENPKGELASKLAEGGFLNTSSVGFIPKEFDDKWTILKSELLEISAVSVPANPEALYEKIYGKKSIKNEGEEVSEDEEDDIIEKGDEEDNTIEGESGKDNGGESGDDDGNSEEESKEEVEEKTGKKVEKVNKKVKTLIKLANIIEEICKDSGRNSVKKTDKAEISRQVNKSIRYLLKIKNK